MSQDDLLNYGLSKNKLFDYMAAGLPILSILVHRYSIEDTYNCSISAENDAPNSIAQAILKAYQSDLSEYRKNALFAASQFDYKVLTEKLIEIIER
jgi:glycosyltransferase involved in cell wall biosynthesis